jgi:predicted GNAT superfamily acetyltransferase
MILAGSTLYSADLFSGSAHPRPLQVGDRWFYNVVFPDSKGYRLTETVQAELRINGTEVFVFFNDDDQHISTNYLWLTMDWHEIRTSRPSIGNLNASSITIFQPPIELVHTPLHVGDKWEVNSTSTTMIATNGGTQVSVSEIRETRQTVSQELARTPVGNIQAFKITVTSSNSSYETLWFSSKLGQIVYAEYYNSLGEAVTQTLTGYDLNETGSNFNSTYNPTSVPKEYTSAGNVPEVISTTNSAFPIELKIPYE